MIRFTTALAALVVIGCLTAPQPVRAAKKRKLTVYHCDATGACEVCTDRICEKPQEQVMCCPKSCGDCTPAELMSQCDPATQVAVYCEHGWSAPICSPDGGGFECLETAGAKAQPEVSQ